MKPSATNMISQMSSKSGTTMAHGLNKKETETTVIRREYDDNGRHFYAIHIDIAKSSACQNCHGNLH